MSAEPPAPTLVAGPYKPPKLKKGVDLPGLVLSRSGGTVKGPHRVLGLTDGPIPWPYTITGGNRQQLVVCGDLERAIRTESVQAVAYWWGVSRWWVERARRQLGVPRMNEGTLQLWKDLAETRFSDKRPHRLSQAQLDQLRKRAAKGERRAALCVEFGISRQYLSLLISGKRRPANAT